MFQYSVYITQKALYADSSTLQGLYYILLFHKIKLVITCCYPRYISELFKLKLVQIIYNHDFCICSIIQLKAYNKTTLVLYKYLLQKYFFNYKVIIRGDTQKFSKYRNKQTWGIRGFYSSFSSSKYLELQTPWTMKGMHFWSFVLLMCPTPSAIQLQYRVKSSPLQLDVHLSKDKKVTESQVGRVCWVRQNFSKNCYDDSAWWTANSLDVFFSYPPLVALERHDRILH